MYSQLSEYEGLGKFKVKKFMRPPGLKMIKRLPGGKMLMRPPGLPRRFRIKLPTMMTEAQARKHIRGIKGLGELYQYQGLGEYNLAEIEDDGLGKFKLKKIIKKVGGFAAGVVGIIPGIKPKMLGVKSESGKKMFKIGKIVGYVAGAAALAVFAGPAIATAIGKGANVALGGLKWAGGRLISIPAKFMQGLKGKQGPEVTESDAFKVLVTNYQKAGKTESEAVDLARSVFAQQTATKMSPEELINLAKSYGVITPGMEGKAVEDLQTTGIVPPQEMRGIAQSKLGVEPLEPGQQYITPTGEKVEAGMFAGMGGALPWVIGGGLLLLTMTGIAKPVSLRGR